MKKIFLVFIAVAIVSCSSEPQETINYPYAFINKKTEKSGRENNTMELYTITDSPNIDTLKMFCQSKKSEFSNGIFYYAVFFDSEEYAVFPNNPFTALYGLDEQPMKHIKAYYEYNRLNGYSKLFVYPKNSWESVAEKIDI